MEACRAWTKSWLLTSGKSAFRSIVDEAKLTPRQQEIIELKFIYDLKKLSDSNEDKYVGTDGRT